MNGYVDTTFYVTIVPSFFPNGEIRSVKAKGITLNRPNTGRGGAVAVKLTVRLPDSAFKPLAPEAVVVVPEGFSEALVVQAEEIPAAPEPEPEAT